MVEQDSLTRATAKLRVKESSAYPLIVEDLMTQSLSSTAFGPDSSLCKPRACHFDISNLEIGNKRINPIKLNASSAMGRTNKAEFDTYMILITHATATTPADTAAINIKKFRGGSARDWLKWSSQFRSLARKKRWTDEQKAHNLVVLIDGDLEPEVEQAAIDAVNTGRSFEEFFTDVGLLSVPADFSEDLDNELWTMKKRRDETVVKFSQRLKENVRMLAELPLNAEEVPEVQQCRYLKRGMPSAWQDKLAAAGIVHDRFSELVLYFLRIEKAELQLSTREKKHGKQSNGRNKDQHGDKNNPKSQHKDEKKNSDRSERKSKSEKCCSFHKTSSHNTSDCYTLKKKERDERSAETKKTSSKRKPRYPRIQRDFESDADSDASEEEFKFVGLVTKKERTTGTPMRIPVEIKRCGHTFDALLDSGACKSIVNGATLAANVNLGRKFLPASPTVFETMNGSVTSNGTIMVQFILPTLNSGSVITHRFEVIEDSHDAMVIGRDVMNALGLVLNFKDNIVQWEEYSSCLNTGREGLISEANKKDDGTKDEYMDENKELVDGAVEPEQLLPDLLDPELAQRYLDLLTEHSKMYDGHLGRMRFDDYMIPLSPDYKPVHAKPYAIPRSQEAKAKEAIQRLINADVLEHIYDSEMASPAFFLVKKDGSLRLLIDYRWLNKYLRRSPYYVPRIREILMRLAKAKCISMFDAITLGGSREKVAH